MYSGFVAAAITMFFGIAIYGIADEQQEKDLQILKLKLEMCQNAR